MLEPTVCQEKGRLLNGERNLQKGFQQWDFFKLGVLFSLGFFFFFFGSNWVAKEQLIVMGVIRKEELCCLSQDQPNISISICLGSKMCLKAAVKR